MTRSVGYQFFLTPGETVEVVEDVVGSSGIHVFLQLEQPGIALERLASVRDILSRTEAPPRLLLTHRELSPAPTPGTFVGSGVAGLVLVALPFVQGNRFYLGDAGAKFVDGDDPDAVFAKTLVRRLERRALHKLLARHIPSGATQLASRLGSSDAALRLAEDNDLELRQFGMENGDFLPVDAAEAGTL